MAAIRIKQGVTSATGCWLPMYWAVHAPGVACVKFLRLKEAKDYAATLGASGKWVRSVEHTGPRGAAQTVYTDAEASEPAGQEGRE